MKEKKMNSGNSIDMFPTFCIFLSHKNKKQLLFRFMKCVYTKHLQRKTYKRLRVKHRVDQGLHKIITTLVLINIVQKMSIKFICEFYCF